MSPGRCVCYAWVFSGGPTTRYPSDLADVTGLTQGANLAYIRPLALALVSAFTCTLVAASPASAVDTAPTNGNPAGPSEVVSHEEASQLGATQQAALVCNFQQAGDYVHISSTPPRSASAHGWWYNTDCKATRATVTIQLQIRHWWGWGNAGSAGSAEVKQGGGSSSRVTARATCANRDSNSWRSVVDVDLAGVADAPNTLTTPARTLACGI